MEPMRNDHQTGMFMLSELYYETDKKSRISLLLDAFSNYKTLDATDRFFLIETAKENRNPKIVFRLLTSLYYQEENPFLLLHGIDTLYTIESRNLARNTHLSQAPFGYIPAGCNALKRKLESILRKREGLDETEKDDPMEPDLL